MDNTGKFDVGTKFIGNVNKRLMEVVKIENKYLLTASGRLIDIGIKVYVKDLKNKKTFIHGVKMLEKCDVTII